MTNKPKERKKHPWREWNPELLTHRPKSIYYDAGKFPKGITKRNRAR